MFLVIKNGLKNITILFLNTKKPLILLQTIKKQFKKTYRTSKKTIRKHKPELVERAEEILSERASMLQREEEALRHAQKFI